MPSTTFEDSRGREWCADFTAAAMKRVRNRHGIDLGSLAANEFAGFMQVAGDPVKLAEVLYCMASHQNPGVTEDEFLDALCGDALHAAADAFQEGFLLFCPSRQREALRALAARSQEAEAAILAAVVEKATEPPTPPAPSSTTATGSPA